jgi:predicted transcriptional regulator
MRTTLTLDDDVAAAIDALARKRRVPLKRVVNEVLRAGLASVDRPRVARLQHRTVGFDLGHSLVGSLDNVEEAIARAEGETHR